jgi:hypothetical protein
MDKTIVLNSHLNKISEQVFKEHNIKFQPCLRDIEGNSINLSTDLSRIVKKTL